MKSDKDAQDKQTYKSHKSYKYRLRYTNLRIYTGYRVIRPISTQSSVVSLHDGDRACHVVDNMVAYTSHYHPLKATKATVTDDKA